MAFVKVVKGLDDAGYVKSADGIIKRAARMNRTPQVTTEVRIGKEIDKLFI